jgi:hypothetical protein
VLTNPPSGSGLLFWDDWEVGLVLFWDDWEVGLEMEVELPVSCDDTRAAMVLGEYVYEEDCPCSL